MKILSVKQIYKADQATIKNLNILSVDLMEQAAEVCTDWINNFLNDYQNTIHVFCGVGNNGGDGLVIARRLLQLGFKVKTYIVNFSIKRSDDFLINYNRLIELHHKPIDLTHLHYNFEISEFEVIIDAIFGIGLTRPPQGFVKEIIQNINNSEAKIIAIDFPSGLPALNIGDSNIVATFDKNAIVKANVTLTFQNPKLAFLLPDNEEFYGDWHLLNIGLDQDFIKSIEADYFLITKNEINKIYKPRSKFSHKGTFGHSLLVGGSFGKIGAVVLASKAALKIGSGLVSAYVPKCGYQIIQTTIPEVMTEVDDEKELQFFNFKTKPTVIGIGMGLGTSSKTTNGFIKFLKSNIKHLVIDADGLNILSMNKEQLKLLPKETVLTPHPKEFERLVGKWKNDYEKLEKLLTFSNKYNCIVVLKGANTVVAYQQKLYFNSTGNPALATGGSGDVLTGIITGLIAQGYNALDAVKFAVYIHGRTADIALQNNYTVETFTASDIYDFFAEVIKEI
ncbi:MAG: NAD(P)H-hydrate dehydratase [Bacteroidota bacterium]